MASETGLEASQSRLLLRISCCLAADDRKCGECREIDKRGRRARYQTRFVLISRRPRDSQLQDSLNSDSRGQLITRSDDETKMRGLTLIVNLIELELLFFSSFLLFQTSPRDFLRFFRVSVLTRIPFCYAASGDLRNLLLFLCNFVFGLGQMGQTLLSSCCHVSLRSKWLSVDLSSFSVDSKCSVDEVTESPGFRKLPTHRWHSQANKHV